MESNSILIFLVEMVETQKNKIIEFTHVKQKTNNQISNI